MIMVNENNTYIREGIINNTWEHQKTYFRTCVPIEDSDQPAPGSESSMAAFGIAKDAKLFFFLFFFFVFFFFCFVFLCGQ